MRWVVSLILSLVALIHALPAVGVLGPDQLFRLYGVPADEVNLALLLRHRAVLFAMLAVFLAVSAARPTWHRPALVVGFASVGSFLLLAIGSGPLNPSLINVVRVDWVALGLLVVGAAADVWRRR